MTEIVDTIPQAEPTPPPPPAHTPREIFVGKDGLRAGWSLLIYIILVVAIGFCVSKVAQRIHPMPPPVKHVAGQPIPPPQPQGARQLFIGETIQFSIVALATFFMALIERRRTGVFGLGGRSTTGAKPIPNFLAGLFWGVLCLSLLILILKSTGLLVFDARLLFGSAVISKYAIVWLVGFLLVGLFEEYLTRGYLQYTLTRGLAGIYRAAFKTPHAHALGFWTAAVLLSVLFGLGHSSNPGESPIGLLSAGTAGFVFAYSLWRTGSLWWAIGFHCTWDWAQSFLYGVADSGTMVQHHLYATHPVGKPIMSGGLTGPEGSIYVLPILALIAIIITLTLRKTPPPPIAADLPA